ncbi:hypothetical protein ACHAQD_012212 [Fusarium lateritium]
MAVAVLYGLDLRRAKNGHVQADSAWIYAEFVAGVSIVVSVAHLIFTTAVWYWALLDGLIFVLWVAQFGVFATTYLKTGEKVDDDEFAAVVSYSRMRSAVWVNLISMLLWLATIIQGIIGCYTRRKNRRQKERAMKLVSVNDLSSTHNAVALQAPGDESFLLGPIGVDYQLCV